MMNNILKLAGKLILLACVILAMTGAPSAHAASNWVWPISGTSTPDMAFLASPFGPRWQASVSSYDYHPGLDIKANLNDPVHAVEAGTVNFTGWLSDSAGNSVILYHAAQNLYTAYLHLNSIAVTKEQAVTRGQVIGAVGDSGSTGFVHLHFEVRLTSNNYPASTRNPLGYLPHAETGAPSIQIVTLTSTPLESPTVTLLIKTLRDETDLNQVRVVVTDNYTHAVLDDQTVDFNLRQHTGTDTLEQDGIKLTPSHFNTSSPDYQLTAYFYNLHGLDAFTLTAYAVDLAGNSRLVSQNVPDTFPPGKVIDLSAQPRPDGGLDFTWTAPGDNNFAGTAAQYDIRFARRYKDITTWDSSTEKLSGLPTPFAGGQTQTWSLSGPLPIAGYYALKTADNEGNWSTISNLVRVGYFEFLPFLEKH
jgi:hypothetical protein